MINQQCDSLINEVEVKREFFLSDLEYEEKTKGDCLAQLIDGWRQQATSVDQLTQYTRDVLRETDPCAFIQVAYDSPLPVQVSAVADGPARRAVVITANMTPCHISSNNNSASRGSICDS